MKRRLFALALALLLAVSLPVRYIHSAHSLAAKQDMEDAYRLLKELIGAFGL